MKLYTFPCSSCRNTAVNISLISVASYFIDKRKKSSYTNDWEVSIEKRLFTKFTPIISNNVKKVPNLLFFIFIFFNCTENYDFIIIQVTQ